MANSGLASPRILRFVPFHLEPGRVPQYQIEPPRWLKTSAKVSSPVHEAAGGSDGFHGGNTREVFAQLFDA